MDFQCLNKTNQLNEGKGNIIVIYIQKKSRCSENSRGKKQAKYIGRQIYQNKIKARTSSQIYKYLKIACISSITISTFSSDQFR